MKDDLLIFGKPIHKQITFDLSDRRLRKYYPRYEATLNPRYYKKAWREIAYKRQTISKNLAPKRMSKKYIQKKLREICLELFL